MSVVPAMSQEDALKLRRMLDLFERGNLRVIDEDEVNQTRAPDVYIAKVPLDGIPAMVLSTGSPAADVPGYADCGIYRIADGVLEPISDLSKRIYNLSENVITDPYCAVIKAKNGAWLAQVSSGGGGQWIDFELAEDFTVNDATVQAYVIEYLLGSGESGTPGTATVTLRNKMDQAWFGSQGFRGLARRLADGTYFIVQLQQDCITPGTA